MLTKILALLLLLLLLLLLDVASSQVGDFSFDGFLNLNGGTSNTPTFFFRLTNGTEFETSHAVYSFPLPFKNSSTGNAFSFSTTYVFAIVPPERSESIGHGMAFVVSPTDNLLSNSLAAQFLGRFNGRNNSDPSNNVFAVELDIFQNREFDDIDSNHVGVDINTLESLKSFPAGYYSDEDGEFKNLSLASGDPMQIWIQYDDLEKQLNVTLYPIDVLKPKRPILSLDIDLSPIILDAMYVGFSSSIGMSASSYYVLAWSFKMNGEAQAIDVSRLPSLPWRAQSKRKSKVLTVGFPLIVATIVLITILVISITIRRKMKSAEVLEDWELDYGSHRFLYKDLVVATSGFAEKQLLGMGGFGKVYRGVLPTSKAEVAVKRISHESRQGVKEFVAEIVSLGRLRHRNLVRLLGYCRRKKELLLVYDLMPNGSLDKFLFDQPKSTLDWSPRYRIIKGVASGLLYLHEDWEQIVIHRDIKASNVLLDAEMNGRLGDFGLARLYGHGSVPHASHVAGTWGYLAPELTRTGKATKSTDVFAFGIFLLEVACGRRPIQIHAYSGEESILTDWVLQCWKGGAILDAADPKLGNVDCVIALEIELVMKLGLLCSHPYAVSRPSIRQVMQYLDHDAAMPELLPDDFLHEGLVPTPTGHGEGSKESFLLNVPPSVQASILSGGR